LESETADLTRVVDTLESLRRELSRLGDRVSALEAAIAPHTAARARAHDDGASSKTEEQAATHAHATSTSTDGLSEELVLVISAAIAAFLGKKAHIRQIRLIGSAVWAQQGRVTIQASHALSIHPARARP
jgi:methylmalonyl-CoA carboxyltransferase large subunit